MKNLLTLALIFINLSLMAKNYNDVVFITKQNNIKDSTINWENTTFIFTNTTANFEFTDCKINIKNCRFIDESMSKKIFLLDVKSGILKIQNSEFITKNGNAIFHNTDGENINISNSQFYNCNNAISLRVNIQKIRDAVQITKNRFEDCTRSINFRAQIKKQKANTNMTFTISCNDFIRNDGVTSYAIYVEPNTRMQDIGDCNIAPAGNDIVDPTNTMYTVANYGQFFTYYRYVNEDFSFLNLPTFPYPSIGVSYNICSTNQATDATCPGKPGILERVVGSNNDGNGYTIDKRYKKDAWFKNSNLGDVMPNPATNQIRIPVTVSIESNNAKLIIYSSVGSKALIKVNITDNKDLVLDISKLNAGMYFYSLMINHAIVDTKKLIIRK